MATKVTVVELSSIDTSQGVTGVYLECAGGSCTLVPYSNNGRTDAAAVAVAAGEWHHVALVVRRCRLTLSNPR